MLQKNYRRKQRLEVLDLLGGQCTECGFADKRALQIDHIGGGGGLERRDIGGSGIHKRILDGVSGYQLLCANCNWIKRHEKKELYIKYT